MYLRNKNLEGTIGVHLAKNNIPLFINLTNYIFTSSMLERHSITYSVLKNLLTNALDQNMFRLQHVPASKHCQPQIDQNFLQIYIHEASWHT